MTELMRKAWLGWIDYMGQGKLAALLLAALLFLWFGRKKAGQEALRLYATVMTVCCILPPAAAVLMAYQTKFYDYVWIWSLVPVTAVAAWGIVLALGELWPDFKPGQWRRGLPGTAILLAAVILCGPLGSPAWNQGGQGAERGHAYAVLQEVRAAYPGKRLCLWAPREIMEYAREADPAILLPYGRNMWDVSLNGYAYDVYDEKTVEMCRWMEELEETDFAEPGAAGRTEAAEEGTALSLPKIYGDYAVSAGVTCILLPEATEQEIILELEKTLQTEARRLEGYWMLYGWTD